jgi:hypothetical protein
MCHATLCYRLGWAHLRPPTSVEATDVQDEKEAHLDREPYHAPGGAPSVTPVRHYTPERFSSRSEHDRDAHRAAAAARALQPAARETLVAAGALKQLSAAERAKLK